MINKMRLCAYALTAVCSVSGMGTSTYEYDELNRLTKVIYEDGSYVEYEYDANGNILSAAVYSNKETDIGGKDDSGEGEDNSGGEDNPEGEENPGGEENSGGEDNPGEEQGIIETIVTTVVKVVTKLVNWIKSLFR